MIKQIIGGVIVVVIGGTSFAASQTDVINNFSKNSGLSKQQAQQYIENIPKSDIESFDKVGQGFVSDGNSITNSLTSIDCANYTYQWETPSLSCSDGKSQMQTVANDEITLGNCYESLGSDLGGSAKATINECIADIDVADADYSFPIISAVLDSNTITNSRNTNAYNKSVLEAALSAK